MGRFVGLGNRGNRASVCMRESSAAIAGPDGLYRHCVSAI